MKHPFKILQALRPNTTTKRRARTVIVKFLAVGGQKISMSAGFDTEIDIENDRFYTEIFDRSRCDTEISVRDTEIDTEISTLKIDFGTLINVENL